MRSHMQPWQSAAPHGTFEGGINMEHSDEYYMRDLAVLTGTGCEEHDRQAQRIKMIILACKRF